MWRMSILYHQANCCRNNCADLCHKPSITRYSCCRSHNLLLCKEVAKKQFIKVDSTHTHPKKIDDKPLQWQSLAKDISVHIKAKESTNKFNRKNCALRSYCNIGVRGRHHSIWSNVLGTVEPPKACLVQNLIGHQFDIRAKRLLIEVNWDWD